MEEDKTKFIHEALVSQQNPYPCEILAKEALYTTLKASTRFRGLRDITAPGIADNAQDLLVNLFWLFFCIKFQPEIFRDVFSKYKDEIRRSYEAIFYELRKTEGTDAIKNLPLIYTWAIIRIFYTTFIKSIVEYDRKFAVKCGQIVYYEIMDIYATEPFIVHELQCLISDPIMDELLPKQQKKEKPPVEEEPVSLITKEAKAAWSDYVTDTSHSKAFFFDQQERIKNLINDIYKKTSLYKSRVESVGVAGVKRSLVTSSDDVATLKYLALMDSKTVEEIIIHDEAYSSVLTTSHVSLVMKKFPRLAHIGRGAAIAYKFPITSEVMEKQLKRRTSPRVTTELWKKPKTEIREKHDEEAFERWIKKGTSNQLLHRMVDKWHKELGSKLINEEQAEAQSIQAHTDNPISVEDTLAHKSLFNSIFRDKISESIKKTIDNYKDINQDSGIIGLRTRNTRMVKSHEELPVADSLLPEVGPPINLKLKSKGRSRKQLQIVPNRKKLEEETKNAENKKKLERIVLALKEVNKNAKFRTRCVLYDTGAVLSHQ